jgi:xanthine/CO dehydrogenase XdhC/CoxF family maturation factor
MAGYDVTVHGPKVSAENYPTAARVVREDWATLRTPPGAYVVVAAEHEDQGPIVRQTLAAQPAYLGLVASRRLSQTLFKRLRQEGMAEEALGCVRTPAGLDLGSKTTEEISLSILAEILASERKTSAYPLRIVKGLLPVQRQRPADPAPAGDRPGSPELLIVGHGRIAEELARLGTLMRWRVTVNSPQAQQGDFPATSCLVTGDLDFSGISVSPSTYVVIATMHKGDHLSMQKVLSERATYIGLVASRKRAGLVLEFLKEKGFSEERMANVHAPAGLDLGAANPSEIALSIMSEVVAAYRGGSCRPLRDVEAQAGSGFPGGCLQGAE